MRAVVDGLSDLVRTELRATAADGVSARIGAATAYNRLITHRPMPLQPGTTLGPYEIQAPSVQAGWARSTGPLTRAWTAVTPKVLSGDPGERP